MTPHDVHTTARLYLCTDARRDRGDFADFVDAAFAGGVDIIQLRDKSIEAAEELELLEVLPRRPTGTAGSGPSTTVRTRLALRRARVPYRPEGHPARGRGRFLRRGHRDRAVHPHPGPGGRGHRGRRTGRSGAGLLLRRTRCGPPPPSRAAPPSGLTWCGMPRSRRQAPTRQGRRRCCPWFAIGGIDLGNVEQVVEAGARRIVVVRAITEADDPAAPPAPCSPPSTPRSEDTEPEPRQAVGAATRPAPAGHPARVVGRELGRQLADHLPTVPRPPRSARQGTRARS